MSVPNYAINERASRISVREWAVLVLLALAGGSIFASRYSSVQPSAQVDLEIGRSAASRLALKYITDRDPSATNVEVRSVAIRTDHGWSAYLQTETDKAIRADLEVFRPYLWWDVILRDPTRDTPIQVRVSPTGEVFRVQFRVPEEESGAKLRSDEAQEIGRRFLAHASAYGEEGWTLLDSRLDRRTDRFDHTLNWSRDVPADSASLRLSMVVAGDQVWSWSREVNLPSEFITRLEPKVSLHTLYDFGVFALVTLLWLAALVMFALRFRSSEVGAKNGFLVVFALLITACWFGWNTEGYATHDAALQEGGSLVTIIIRAGLGIQIFFTSLGLFFVWNSGESVAREIWPAKVGTFDKLFAQRFFTRDVGAGIVRGTAMAAISLGLWFGMAPFFQAGRWSIIGNEDLITLGSKVPFGLPVVIAVMTAILMTAYAHLFGLGVLRQLFKRLWPAVLVTSIVFGASFSETTVLLDRWVGAVLSILVGLVSYGFFIRYNLWTVFCGVLTMRLALGGALFITHPAFWTSGVAAFVVLGLLLVYGVVALLRGENVADTSVAPAYVRFISERERLKLELDIARQAQLRMLPERVPRPTGLDVAAFSEPAKEVGGDYYDFMEFADGRLGIVVGDVSGKGMPAALYMTMLKGFLQSRSETDSSPVSVLAHVNRMFGHSSDRSMFATMVYAVLDVKGGLMTLARAGHCPVIVYRESDASTFILQPPGLGIGLERTDLFERVTLEETLKIRAGDVIVLFSDGITEARDSREEEYGTDRLIQLVRTSSGSAEHILSRIRADHTAFVGSHEPHDDLTCVVVKLVA